MKNKKNMKKQRKSLQNFVSCFLLILASVLLFILEHPGFILKNGFGLLAFFSYIPLLFAIKRCNVPYSALAGGVYGVLSYALFGFWLGKYSVPGYLAVAAGYFFILAFVCVVLKICELLFPKNYWLVQWLVLVSYEFLKTLGFAGFNYGVSGYALWRYPFLIQVCDLCGIFGFSAFVIFPSFFIFGFVQKTLEKRSLIRKIETDDELFEANTHIKSITTTEEKLNLCSRQSSVIAAIVWIFALIFVLIYGKASKKDYQDFPKVKVLAVQTNDDPWKNGVNAYAENLLNVTKLTDLALEINPDVDIVVWPETAIVPAIVYQYQSKKDSARYKIITYLLDFINEKNAAFVIGNGHTVVSQNGAKKSDFNSALVFEPGKNVIPPEPYIYSKMHLVPFSETFPYEKQFPLLYKFLLERGNHMWTAGNEYTVFNVKGLSFSCPICYEDTFEENSRMMYKNGSRCFINLSNDAWCHSIESQNQHLSMAVFRSVENRVPSVRSTASGQTCFIDPNGKILNMAEPFAATYSIGEIPVLPPEQKETVSCRLGKFFGFLFVVLTCLLLLSKLIIAIIKKIRD